MEVNIEVTKKSGKKDHFSIAKLKNSLVRSGANEALVEKISNQVRDELYQGISTREIYNRAYALLKTDTATFASRYKLKKAIYELGPTGFPFEKFIASLLSHKGYKVQTGKFYQGRCVRHEIDVVALKNDQHIIGECKFHSEEGRNCDVKIPLYINSRYQDILGFHEKFSDQPTQGWVVTNTRFTEDALTFGKCCGLYLLSWDYPIGNGLKDRIDSTGLYPITVSTLLSAREKQFLLSRDVVLCKQLIDDSFYLDHLGISEKRKDRIIAEFKILSKNSHHAEN